MVADPAEHTTCSLAPLDACGTYAQKTVTAKFEGVAARKVKGTKRGKRQPPISKKVGRATALAHRRAHAPALGPITLRDTTTDTSK
jgi:hypothetical protein